MMFAQSQHLVVTSWTVASYSAGRRNRRLAALGAARKDGRFAMIYVCSLRAMPMHVRTLRPHRVVSLVAPAEQPPTPPGLPADRHLRIEIDDVCVPCEGAIVPCAEHIGRLLDRLDEWTGTPPILIHCVAGVSRSMAAALITAASRAPERELELALRLRQAAPHAQPNRLMIEFGDALLGCNGRLVAAADAMGAAVPIEQAPLVRFAFNERTETGRAAKESLPR